MDNLIITNSANSFSELLIDYDLGSFKYEVEKNSSRSLALTVFKTSFAPDIYDLIQNESILIFRGQQYVIKTTDPKVITSLLRMTLWLITLCLNSRITISTKI